MNDNSGLPRLTVFALQLLAAIAIFTAIAIPLSLVPGDAGRIIATVIALLPAAAGAYLLWDRHGKTGGRPLFDDIIEPFPPRPAPDDGNWEAWLRKGIRIGRWRSGPNGERPGGPVWLRWKGRHVGVWGESGYGKSTFEWQMFTELAPAIEAGALVVHGFDLKGGMELYPACHVHTSYTTDDKGESLPAPGSKPLLARENFHYGAAAFEQSDEEATILYESTFLPPMRKVVAGMRDRADQIRRSGSGREHVARPGNPHHLVVIDESALIARKGIGAVGTELVGLVMTLLQQGRAPGYTVLVCSQYPRLEENPFRHWVNVNVCFKVRTKEGAKMALGEDALERQPAHRLPASLPGVCYIAGDVGGARAMPARVCLAGPPSIGGDDDPEDGGERAPMGYFPAFEEAA